MHNYSSPSCCCKDLFIPLRQLHTRRVLDRYLNGPGPSPQAQECPLLQTHMAYLRSTVRPTLRYLEGSLTAAGNEFYAGCDLTGKVGTWRVEPPILLGHYPCSFCSEEKYTTSDCPRLRSCQLTDIVRIASLCMNLNIINHIVPLLAVMCKIFQKSNLNSIFWWPLSTRDAMHSADFAIVKAWTPPLTAVERAQTPVSH